MAKVHLLDDELINKIAAGEVVERPASVVKELLENGIDAGATHIKVSLKDGGRQLIQVQDDGFGMGIDDALLAVKRHTTSKLARADDLFQVSTMGFRGEALASISSVSRFTLQTQARGSEQGSRVTIEDGQVHQVPWQGSTGTTLTVADLFYNVPARKAFLKTAAAEFAACHEYMQALAMSLPAVGFTLLHNDREIFSVSPLPVNAAWPRGELPLRQRAEALFGTDIAQPLIYIQKTDRYARVEGLISAPGQDKGSAKYILTFVNQRWVRDKLLRYGIMRGFHSHLLKGKFPIAFLSIDIDPALVDVNVHPSKTELRFQYGTEVQNAIAMALREGLRQKTWAQAPSMPERVARPESSRPMQQPLPVDFDLLLGALPETGNNLQAQNMGTSDQSQGLSGDAAHKVGLSPQSDQSHGLSGDAAHKMGLSPQSDDQLALASDRGLQDSARAGASAKPLTVEGRPSADTAESYGPSLRANGPYDARKAAGKDSLAASANARSTPTIKRTTMSFDAGHELQLRSPTSAGSSIDSGAEARREPSSAGSLQLPSMPISMAPSRSSPSPASGEIIPWDQLQYIGAFARCYLLFEYQDQLLAVDQHAFHERVLYERLARDPKLMSSTQPLLMPEVLDFSPTERVELEQQRDQFQQWGIHYEIVSASEIEVKAVPSILINKDLSGLVHGLLAGARSRKELSHDVLATLACHAAVRAGEDLPGPELQALLNEARTVDFYHNCPHGRRVFRWWKQSQVAAWFDRLG